jgi:hypothetical protein
MGNLLLQDSAISPAAVPAAAQSLARRKESSQRGWPASVAKSAFL